MVDPLAPGAEPPRVLTAAELQRSASAGAIWTLAHVIIALPVAFVANAIVARNLSADGYGRLAILTLVMAVATMASNFGVSEAVQQWGAAAYAKGDDREVDRMLRSSLGFHLMTQLPILVVVAIVVGIGQSWPVKSALLFTAVVGPVLGSASLCISIENRTAQASRLAMVTNLFTQTAVSVTAVVTHSAVAVWASRSVFPAAAIAGNFALITPHRRRVALQARLPRTMPAGFWRFGAFSVTANVLSVLVTSRSEIFVLQWRGTLEAVGVYALAFGVASQLRGPVEALLAPLMPSAAGIVEAHPHLVPPTILRAMRLSALFSGGLLVMVPLLFPVLPVVYGEEFRPSAQLLPALAIVALSQGLANPLYAFARAQKMAGLLLLSNAIALTVDLAVAFMLIPQFGMWGAVVATSLAQLTSLATLGLLQVRRSHIEWFPMLQACMPFALAALVNGLWLIWPAAISGWTVQWLVGLGGVAAWCVCLRLILPDGARDDLARIPAALPARLQRLASITLRLMGVPTAGERA